MSFSNKLTQRVKNFGHRDPAKWYPHDYFLRYLIIPFIPAWIYPNHITVLRFILVPFVLWFLYIEHFDIGVPLFLFAAFTDALDGSLARVRHQITDWGTFYDPFADKLLITGVILIVVVHYINPIFALLVVGIECIIFLGGCVRKRRGEIASANVFGKTKMFLQVTAVLFLLIAAWAGADLFIDASIATFSLAIAFAILSLFTYGL